MNLILIPFLFLIALFATVPAADAKSNPPNIVFILADDLGWTELGCCSNRFNETPNLDRLSTQVIRFTQAYAAAPVCSPTRAALMTGQFPARLHITDYLKSDDEKFLSPDYVTLNEQLKKAGYISGLIGKWHLNGDYSRHRGTPAQHGFDEVICSEQADIRGGSYWHPYKFMTNVAARMPHEYLTDRLNLEALEFIERHQHEKFFLYLAHYATHTQLKARPDKLKKFAAKTGAGKKKNNPELAAMLESLDDGVGDILRKLDELKLADNTVVIFNSDNGGERTVTDNFPLRAGKSFLYEGGLRVPCIVRWPGKIKPGAICDEPIITHDFYPTLMEVAGVKANKKQIIDGANLVPLFQGATHLKRDTLFWHYPMAKPHFLGGVSASAIRAGDFKLIEFPSENRVELYDLQKDLAEQHDLADAQPKKTKELQKKLHDWLKAAAAE